MDGRTKATPIAHFALGGGIKTQFAHSGVPRILNVELSAEWAAKPERSKASKLEACLGMQTMAVIRVDKKKQDLFVYI